MKFYFDTRTAGIAGDLVDLLTEYAIAVDLTETLDIPRLEPLRPAWSGGIFVTARDFDEVAGSSRVAAFVQSGGRVVVIGDGPSDGGRQEAHWVFLTVPYTNAGFIDAINRALL